MTYGEAMRQKVGGGRTKEAQRIVDLGCELIGRRTADTGSPAVPLNLFRVRDMNEQEISAELEARRK